MEPENASLEKRNHLPNHHFQVLCESSGVYLFSCKSSCFFGVKFSSLKLRTFLTTASLPVFCGSAVSGVPTSRWRRHVCTDPFWTHELFGKAVRIARGRLGKP